MSTWIQHPTLSKREPDSATAIGPLGNSLPSRTIVGDPVAEALKLVGEELPRVEHELTRLMDSEEEGIPDVMNYVTGSGGKRLRPLLVLLCARAAGWNEHQRFTVAAVGELLHTATLLHDDVVDEGEFRRGRPAARLKYGNGLSILTGDYCYARAVQAIAQLGSIKAVQSLANTVTEMAEGEFAQLHLAGDWHRDRARYYSIIERKTAALIAWCTSVADMVESELAQPLRSFGIEMGYAFQIADDVLDYTSHSDESGKAQGQDLSEGKLTLPLLLACRHDEGLSRQVRAFLEKSPSPHDSDWQQEHASIVATVSKSPAIEQASQLAEAHAHRASEHLLSLPESPAREVLRALAVHVARRSV